MSASSVALRALSAAMPARRAISSTREMSSGVNLRPDSAETKVTAPKTSPRARSGATIVARIPRPLTISRNSRSGTPSSIIWSVISG